MKTEKTIGIIFLAGLILKVLHLPLGSVTVVLALGALGVLYFPAAFYFFCDKTIEKQNLGLSIVAGLLLAMVPVGILFKLQYWPGAQVYLLAGAIAAPIL